MKKLALGFLPLIPRPFRDAYGLSVTQITFRPNLYFFHTHFCAAKAYYP